MRSRHSYLLLVVGTTKIINLTDTSQEHRSQSPVGTFPWPFCSAPACARSKVNYINCIPFCRAAPWLSIAVLGPNITGRLECYAGLKGSTRRDLYANIVV